MARKNWKEPGENEGFVDYMLRRDEQQDSQTDSSNEGSSSLSSAKKVTSSSATSSTSKKGESSAINSMSDRLYVKLDSIDSNVRESNDQLRIISKYSEDSSIWLSEIYDLLNLNGRDRSNNRDTSKDAMQTGADNATGSTTIDSSGVGAALGLGGVGLGAWVMNKLRKAFGGSDVDAAKTGEGGKGGDAAKTGEGGKGADAAKVNKFNVGDIQELPNGEKIKLDKDGKWRNLKGQFAKGPVAGGTGGGAGDAGQVRQGGGDAAKIGGEGGKGTAESGPGKEFYKNKLLASKWGAKLKYFLPIAEKLLGAAALGLFLYDSYVIFNDKNTSNEQKHAEFNMLLTKNFVGIALYALGSALGAAIGGTVFVETGPGAILAGVAGGIVGGVAAYFTPDTVYKAITDFIFSIETQKVTRNISAPQKIGGMAGGRIAAAEGPGGMNAPWAKANADNRADAFGTSLFGNMAGRGMPSTASDNSGSPVFKSGPADNSTVIKSFFSDDNKSLATDIKDRGEQRNRLRESGDIQTGNRDRQDQDVVSMQWADAMKVSSNGEGGRSAAESYLGRKMSDEEYDYLVRATHAEASAGKNADPKEQAMIMASILNRARDMGKNGVIEALTAKNQFQSVTGTKANDNAPSENFTQGPDADRKNSIESSAAMLGGISRDQENFTAASSGAYGAGTNIGYRDDMIASGGTQIGGSVFNTAGPQDMGAYSPVDAVQQKPGDSAEEDKDAAGGLTTIRTASGKTAQVGEAYASNLQGFITDLEGTGYKINSLGGYANRANVNNPSVKSYHAMGAAIDINPEQNPNNSTKSDLPPETGALAAKHGLGWGMNWKSVKDPMHFSAAKSEQGSFDIKRGSIAPGEVQGGAAPGGGGNSDATVASKSLAGSGAPSAPAAGGSKASGGIAGAFSAVGKFAGNLIGDLSKSTSMKSATPQVAAASTGGSYGGGAGDAGRVGSSKLPTGGSSDPKVAIDQMFAKLFDGSAMFG